MSSSSPGTAGGAWPPPIPGVAEGVNIDQGRVTNQAVAATFGLPLHRPGTPGRPTRGLPIGVGLTTRLSVDWRRLDDRPGRTIRIDLDPETLPMTENDDADERARARTRPRPRPRARGRGGARGGPRARHPEPDLPGDAAAEPRPAEDRRRGRRLHRAAPGPLKPGDLKNALKSIWDIYSEFYAWIDPEESEDDDEDEDDEDDE